MSTTITRFPTKEHRPPKRDVPVAADTLIPFGILVALDRSDNAVAAADAPHLTIAGVAMGPGACAPREGMDCDNRGRSAGVKVVHVKTGLYCFLNSIAAPVTAADLGQPVFVEDERTVARSTSANARAGIAIGLTGAVYVWLFVGPPGTVPGSPTLGESCVV